MSKITKQKIKSILIADDVHEELIVGLKNAGFNVLYLPGIEKKEVLVLLNQGLEGVVFRSKINFDKELITAGKQLKFIARAGAGMDSLDQTFANKKQIFCFNAGEANADAVGEHTVGMLLMLLNKLAIANQQVKNKIWLREENRGTELAGKTIGIIGFGNTGKAVALKLSGFNVKVLVYDKYLKNYGNQFATQSTMSKIFNHADIITFHIPLTNLTKHMVDYNYLNRFKKNIFLLNLSRGKIVETQSLIKLVKNNKILGAALDVLENENLDSLNEKEQEEFAFLANNVKIILTPHVGGWTYESYYKISKVLLNKILTRFEPI